MSTFFCKNSAFHCASRIRLADCSKLVLNWKNDNDVTFYRYDVIVQLFWRFLVSLVKFSYWSKFHVNIIASSWVMKVFFYKGLNRNLEIRITPFYFLSNIWRQGRFRNTSFGTNVSNKKFLDRANASVIAFTVSELLRENQQGMGGVKLPHPYPSLLELNIFCKEYNLFKDHSTLGFLLKWLNNYSNLLYGKILAEI